MASLAPTRAAARPPVDRARIAGRVLTGSLGGAVLAHLRAGSPLLGFTLFPVYFGIVLWAGLWLRDSRVRALVR